MRMNHKDALHILGLKIGAKFEEIKPAYRSACRQYHPDINPAGLEMMKLVNCAYQALSDYVASDTLETDDNASFGDEINEALNKIIHLGLTIEICGSWIWVSGDTRPHKEALKEANFKWAPKKFMWHFRPSDYKSFNRSSWDMDKIRSAHGSHAIKSKIYKQVAA